MSTSYPYTSTIHRSLEKAISQPRLARYLSASGGCRDTALKLYHWNSVLSQSMIFPLHILEVCLRNTISNSLKASFGNKWYIHKGFLTALDRFSEDQLRKVYEQKGKRKKILTEGDIISELTFGFWRELLKSRYNKHIWTKKSPTGKTLLKNSFPNLPFNKNRQDIYDNINNFVKLRNRISHYEAIYDIDDLRGKYYEKILDTTGWICCDTLDWLNFHSTFIDTLSAKPIV